MDRINEIKDEFKNPQYYTPKIKEVPKNPPPIKPKQFRKSLQTKPKCSRNLFGDFDQF